MKLNKLQDKQYNELLTLIKPLRKENNANYTLIYKINRLDKLIFCLFVFNYSIVDGKKTYQPPKKIYRTYESMREYLQTTAKNP